MSGDELIEFDLAIDNLLYQVTRAEDVSPSLHYLVLHLQVSEYAHADSLPGPRWQHTCPSDVLVALTWVDIQSYYGFYRLRELPLLRDLLHLLNGLLGSDHIVEIEDLCRGRLRLGDALRGCRLLGVEDTQYYEMKSCAFIAYPHSC